MHIQTQSHGEKNIAALKETVPNATKSHVPCNLYFFSLANQCYCLLPALGVALEC